MSRSLREQLGVSIYDKSLKYIQFSILLYHAFAQTTIFTNDPFFETFCEGERFSSISTCSSRQKIMNEVGRSILDPKATSLWSAVKTVFSSSNVKFTPVLYNYQKIALQIPVFYRGDRAQYTYFKPTPVAETVKAVYIYTGIGVPEQVDTGTGSVNFYFFTGKTGMTYTHPRDGRASIMGCVAHDTLTGEVTIAFRGSRSGCGVRELLNAQLHSEGNADWVSDMNATKFKNFPELTGGGDDQRGRQLAVGFGESYLSMQPSIHHLLFRVIGLRNMTQITTTGHSLGGALATVAWIDLQRQAEADGYFYMFEDDSVAFQDGRYRRNLCARAECFPFSSPQVCNADTMRAFPRHAQQVFRIYVEGDFVTGGNAPRVAEGVLSFGIVPLYRYLWQGQSVVLHHLGRDLPLTRGGQLPGFSDPHEFSGVHTGIQKVIGNPLAYEVQQAARGGMEVGPQLKALVAETLSPSKKDVVCSKDTLKALLTGGTREDAEIFISAFDLIGFCYYLTTANNASVQTNTWFLSSNAANSQLVRSKIEKIFEFERPDQLAEYILTREGQTFLTSLDALIAGPLKGTNVKLHVIQFMRSHLRDLQTAAQKAKGLPMTAPD